MDWTSGGTLGKRVRGGGGGVCLVNMKAERLGGSRGQRKLNCGDSNRHSATACGSGATRRAVN